MKINPTKNYLRIGFRSGVTLETLRRVNKLCIIQGKEAKRLGIGTPEYLDMQNAMGNFSIDIGNNKKINCYDIAREILSDKEKLKDACKKAWRKCCK